MRWVEPRHLETRWTDIGQYPSQHIGYLEESHVKALEEFKQLSKSKGYYKPAEGDQPASHDDETMLYGQQKTD